MRLIVAVLKPSQVEVVRQSLAGVHVTRLTICDAQGYDSTPSARGEFHEALVQAVAGETTEPVDSCVLDWRTTAKALSDKKRRRILTGKPEAKDFEEVSAPD